MLDEPVPSKTLVQPSAQSSLESAADELISWVTKLGSVLAIIGVYTSFAGWAYTVNFYQEFGLSARALDIPVSQYVYYAFATFWALPALIVIAYFVGLVVLIKRLKGPALMPTGLVLLVLAFPIIYNLASWRAHIARDSFEKVAPRVRLYFKESKALSADSELELKNAGGQLRSLTQTKDCLYVFSASENAVPQSYAISRSDLLYFEIKPER